MTHGTFTSPSMGIPVGYNIYLPTGYEEDTNRNISYPVIYFLHGGRPGSESKNISLVGSVHAAIESRQVRPIIFVWVNGGEVSHYNYGDSRGEDVFVKELIPYIDRTYRTIDRRGGRALQGFSQGGRGTTRIMFKHPELFISAAPGGPGYGMERQNKTLDSAGLAPPWILVRAMMLSASHENMPDSPRNRPLAY
jgi:endo-1,4-beta-xylanase